MNENQQSITHPELVRTLVKPGWSIIASITPEKADLWHAATGIAGEGGELLEGIDTNTGRENAIEECGDLLFYIEQMVQNTGIELDWKKITQSAGEVVNAVGARLFSAIRVATYAAAVLDTVKKHTIYNKDLDVSLLKSQLESLCTYIIAVGIYFGFSRNDARKANIKKLSKRYADFKYSDQAAQARADKPEGE